MIMAWKSQGRIQLSSGIWPLGWLKMTQLRSSGTFRYRQAKFKQRKTAVALDVALPSDSDIGKKEDVKIKKYQELREKMWSGPCGNQSTQGSDGKNRRVAKADPRNGSRRNLVLGTPKILPRTLKILSLW